MTRKNMRYEALLLNYNETDRVPRGKTSCRGAMKRKPILLALCGFACAPFAHAQAPAIDAAFAAAPFQQWIAQGPKAELPWHSRITTPTLTLRQSMAVPVAAQLHWQAV